MNWPTGGLLRSKPCFVYISSSVNGLKKGATGLERTNYQRTFKQVLSTDEILNY